MKSVTGNPDVENRISDEEDESDDPCGGVHAGFRHSAFDIRVWLTITFLLSLLSFRTSAFAQARYLGGYQEPRWLTFNLSQVSAGAYVEGTFDETRFKNSDTTVRHEHLFAGPSIGFSANGSVYHPNLLTYSLNSDGAFGWARDSFHTAGSSSSSDEFEYLGSFSAGVDLLSGKPYTASAFANYDHTFHDNDFFSRVTVDSWRYGARALWHPSPNWTLTFDYGHRDEESSAPVAVSVSGTNAVGQSTVTHEDTIGFSARNERQSGGSSLNYSWHQYSRVDLGRPGEGNDQSISVADNERFGSHDRFRLNSSLNYFHREIPDETSDEITAYGSFGIEHRPNLNSSYDLNFDHFDTGDADQGRGGFSSDNYSGQASLQHQLYDSLTSTLIARGSDYESSDVRSSGYTRRYGGGLVESYTKQITDDSRVRISNSLFVDHTDQQNIGIVKNERHTFSEAGGPPNSFFLELANVNEATIVVTDAQDSAPGFVENVDYRVSQLGTRTLIERPIGSRIPIDAAVLVDYQALPSAAGSYEDLTEVFQIRFELWKNLVGVYSRVSLSRNNAPPELRVQQITAYTFGTDLTWRSLRAGAEYEVYDSTESDYSAVRLFQSLAFHPDEASSLSVDFSEAWIDYTSAHRQEQQYQFITRYHRALSHRFSLGTDAGIAVRRGVGVDQFVATFRPTIKYVIGKTTLDAGYDYEYETFLDNEERQKHIFFLRLRRFF